MFFGSNTWMLHFDTAEVKHIMRQASDHSLLLLDCKPERNKTKSRFIFENRWLKMQETENLIKEVWDQQIEGSRMFTVQQKLKQCKHQIIKWRKKGQRQFKSGNREYSERNGKHANGCRR